MIFTQYYLDCLSQASYLIGDETTGRAAVVDPRRDIDEYVRDAAAAGLTIEYVIETHFHADFLSGHLELARATGATIVYGAAAQGATFEFHPAQDGERLVLGDVVLEILATPGHTPESISVVVWEHADDEVPYGVLTGDTLFIGDVGRPDLLASFGVTADELAGMLYTSVQDKLLGLPDATRVFPGHGAGSACGKNLSTETQSTMGEQRRTNYALRPMGRDQFVAAVTEGQSTPPSYFPYDAVLNRQTHDLHDESVTPPALTWDELLAAQQRGAVLLDTREAQQFANGHVRGSVNVGLDGRFSEYTGAVLAHDVDIVLICEAGAETQARTRLARIGYDRVVGHLAEAEAAMFTHPEGVTRSSRLTAAELARRLEAGEDAGFTIVDVRGPGEFATGAVPGSISVPLAELTRRVDEIDRARPVVVNCAGGYRSMIAASYLEANGFGDVSDLIGGYTAWLGLVPSAS
ncbi:MAG: MBL fold metallo-hydrolase [Acidimicrobiales bacterium]|nr:MBL fold metallo-hydrolase [Acidimicrobiales bacterium]